VDAESLKGVRQVASAVRWLGELNPALDLPVGRILSHPLASLETGTDAADGSLLGRARLGHRRVWACRLRVINGRCFDAARRRRLAGVSWEVSYAIALPENDCISGSTPNYPIAGATPRDSSP
jgi:hypothetical protein